jgi:hypothetical protein
MKFPKEDEYMDLRMEKSMVINLNFFEQNVAISKNKQFGFTSGLGFSWHLYRFSKPTHLNADSSVLRGYLADGISVRRSRLTTWHLTLPLLFEWQTNNTHKKNSFHVGAGMIVGTRLLSWFRVRYNESDKDFELKRYNPETGVYETEYTSRSPGHPPKIVDTKDWFLKPFQFDATLRIGWGWINLWTTFSVNTLFRTDKGPELYPWSAGITLINF